LCLPSRPDPGSSGLANSSSSGLVEEQQWPCSACTFLNHPALKNCEECDMPRIVVGTKPDGQQLQQQPGRPCYCHSRSLFQSAPAELPEPILRRVKSEKAASFDELSPVREMSPTASSNVNSNNDLTPLTDETWCRCYKTLFAV
jgi:hypothetical protein